MSLLAWTAMILLASAGPASPRVNEVKDTPRRSTDLPPPRDGNIAVREELDAARRAGTIQAYDLFITRHPRHALAAVARRERARLAGQRP